MSVITYSCYFLLSIFCISLHACNARPLADVDKKPEKKFQMISNQTSDQKEIPVNIVSEANSSSSNDFGAEKEDSIAKTDQMDDNAQKLMNSKAKQKSSTTDEKVKDSGAAHKASLVSVSWPVPRKKRGETHPGFNLDYAPPKTHPPSHN
ncbi:TRANSMEMBRANE PROTEIN [Salix viminalis]|uniref:TRANSMEMBRANE PROTEIN n=1 Tax=Salix viminalis TaxID=40686 RepID=A0A9Q0NTF4_SALVM|nr:TRANSMEMBRANE PROTEIN [Salix viminalis]